MFEQPIFLKVTKGFGSKVNGADFTIFVDFIEASTLQIVPSAEFYPLSAPKWEYKTKEIKMR